MLKQLIVTIEEPRYSLREWSALFELLYHEQQAAVSIEEQPPVGSRSAPASPPEATSAAVLRTGDRTSAIDLCNRYVFTFAVGIVLLELVGCFTKTVTWSGVAINSSYSDLPLLVGFLVIFCGNFDFYKRVIEPRGESAGAALYSLFGMLAMASLPLLMLSPKLLPVRYFFLLVFISLVKIKTDRLRRRFDRQALGDTFRALRRRVTYYLLAMAVFSTAFYLSVKRYPLYTVKLSLGFNIVLLSALGFF